jgi:DNA-binding transcriptional regulator YiaG
MPRLGDRKEIKIKEVPGSLDTPCHECTSHSKDTIGYPIVRVNKKLIMLVRFLFEKSNGKIREGMVIRHKCDNRACINLDHIEIGTQKDNIWDSMRRDKQKIPVERKLFEDDVKQIRTMIKSGMSQNKIADYFGVHQSEVSRIKTGKRFAWIN